MLTFLLLACPPAPDDSGKPDDSGTAIFPDCRSGADCTDGSSCFAPGACNVGDYTDPVDACGSSDDCDDGRVCQPYAAACGVGAYTACVDSCLLRTCDADQQCDSGTGICLPWSCEAGFTCADHTTCVGAAGDANGCARDTCSVDGDCTIGGYCVEGSCYDALGSCEFAVP